MQTHKNVPNKMASDHGDPQTVGPRTNVINTLILFVLRVFIVFMLIKKKVTESVESIFRKLS